MDLFILFMYLFLFIYYANWQQQIQGVAKSTPLRFFAVFSAVACSSEETFYRRIF